MCLTHHTPSSGGKEHARPRTFDNEMTREGIAQMSGFIIDLADTGMKTADLHKTVQQKSGKRLGVEGKAVVRSIVDRHEKASREAFNDAQKFLQHLQHSKAHMWFKADEQARITSIAWASDVQKATAVNFHSVIITDTTFNTNR
ncbi:unnamed protein product [Ectocarpus sp. CCAP 1310/34]|nr:unnamed protein product [Ectocarpus sp. CCAP 1310/34]